MRVLALDAATEACSVALYDGDSGDPDRALIWRHEEIGRGHADRILEMVDEVLDQAQTGLESISGIAAGIGPGAFTGVRITLAAAQGLAFGAGLPVVAVSTLEALAFAALQNDTAAAGAVRSGGSERALICLDARMGEVYWGCYAPDALRGVRSTQAPRVDAAPAVRLPDAFAHRGMGRGFAAYPALARIMGVSLAPLAADALPSAREMARIGMLRLIAGEGRDPAQLTPLYLRDKVALTEVERGVR